MKGADHEIRVTPSVLDRLVDTDPKSMRDTLPTRAESVRAFHRAVQRDLENLLNSRNSFADLLADYAEAGQSVLTYGLPDFSAFNTRGERDRNRLRQIIETTIRTFEPRMSGIVATLTPPTPTDPSLRLHVEARLLIEPSPEAVAFDIVMPLHSRRCEVRERD